MAKEGQDGRLDAIMQAVHASAAGAPPVHLWNPPDCGPIDIRIASDGTWFYLNSPIGRPALVRLFASVLRREGDNYYLVTPVEKCRILVEDAPFIAVDVEAAGEGQSRILHFRTNVGDEIVCGPDNPLRFERDPQNGGLKPYIHVRRGLWAKVTRAAYYDLVELGEERSVNGELWFGVASQGEFYPMAPVRELEGLVP
jgi:hypothetical protein